MANVRMSRIREPTILAIGLLAGGLWATFGLRPIAATEAKGASAEPLEVVLYKYRIANGNAERFEEWMRRHAANHAGLVETLAPERTYAEAIFRDWEHDPQIFYWMVVKGKGGRPVEQSELPLDKIHLTYVRSVLDKTPRTTFTTEMTLVPTFITHAISEHEAQQ